MSSKNRSKSQAKRKPGIHSVKRIQNQNDQVQDESQRTNQKYSKRAISDNHYKYQLPELSDDDNDNDDGSIITHKNIESSLTSVSSGSHFRIDEYEKEWDKVKDNQFSSMLKINLPALAKSLERVPLSTLLKINDTDFMPYITTETYPNAMDMQSSAMFAEEDMENLRKDAGDATLSSSKQLEKIKESNLHIKLSNIDSALIENDRKENEELDNLLALNEMDLEDTAVSDNVISDDMLANSVDMQPIPVALDNETDHIESITAVDNKQIPKKENLDDLESWLDSVID